MKINQNKVFLIPRNINPLKIHVQLLVALKICSMHFFSATWTFSYYLNLKLVCIKPRVHLS